MNRKIICYVMSLIILINILPSTSITVKAEKMFITGYIEVFSDIDNTARKIKALNNEEIIFVSAEDISLITGYDLEIGDFINYSKAGGMDTITAVDIEFDGMVSAMGKKFEIHIVNDKNEIYLPLIQMLYLLHAQWWISEDKLIIKTLPYTIIDFLGSENYISMWENKVNQTDLLINGENKLAHVLRTSLAAVFNDFDPEIFILWWPDKGVSPILNKEYEEALLQIVVDDMDFLNTYDQKSMLSVFEELGFSEIKSDWDNMKNIIDIPNNIAEGAWDIDEIVSCLSKDKALKSYFIYDFETLDPAILKATSQKMENISNVLDITSIILDVAEISQRSHNWGEQYINQIRVLTDFDDRGYNKSIANNVKTVANGLIKEYQDPIQAAADEAALQSTSLFLSKIFDESVFGKYFAVFSAGISIAKTNENVKNDMDAADLAYMVDCLVKVEQIAMKEMSRSYSKLLGNNITGDFTQTDLERLRNCTMLSLRTNLRNRAFIYYLNLRLNDDNNWESSIYAQNIQRQIIDDYARICLLMETEKYDTLLFLDDFKNIYSNQYGLIREQPTFAIFHEGEIADETINYNNKEWNEYLSLLCTYLTDYSEQEQDFSELMWFAYKYIDWNDFSKITYDNVYAIISKTEIDKVLKQYFDKISPYNSCGDILYNNGMFYYPGVTFAEIGRPIAIVNDIETVNGEYKVSFNTAYIWPENFDTGELNPIEDWNIYYEYTIDQIKVDAFCEILGNGYAVVELKGQNLIVTEFHSDAESFGNSESFESLTEEEAYKKVEAYWRSLGYNMPEEVEYEGLTESGHCFWGYNMIDDHAVTHFRIYVDVNTGQITVGGGIYCGQ